MIPTYRPLIGEKELQAVRSVFSSGWLGMGEVCRRFEDRLQTFLGAAHVVGVSHGTDALHLALAALALQPEDEVIVPSLTFVATIQAIRMVGAVPVFCEVDPQTLNLDIDDVLSRITDRTRVILPVHFAGLPCDLDRLLTIARQHQIRIGEDAAHAFGSTYKGDRIGSFGDLTCFSFDSIKTITCGEGGAVATQDAALARQIARLRCLGIDRQAVPLQAEQQGWQYQVLSPGYRSHLSNLNAAIGLVQLDCFEQFAQRRRELARRYDQAFADLASFGIQPIQRQIEETCPWAYVIRVQGDRRDALRHDLEQRGIQTLIQFIPNHLQPAFASWRVPLPATEQAFKEIVSLPFFVELSDAEQAQVIQAIREFALSCSAVAS
jgi:dTDP-4-amino-4,6-dideoxygalactose transaminase